MTGILGLLSDWVAPSLIFFSLPVTLSSLSAIRSAREVLFSPEDEEEFGEVLVEVDEVVIVVSVVFTVPVTQNNTS